jgi:hypothetical protein
MSLQRFLFQSLVHLHPPAFRRRFGREMIWIYDEVAPREGCARLFADAFLSLGRQWLVRTMLQRFLIGDAALSPAPTNASGLFAWERIGLPEQSLPPSRLVQGAALSLAVLTCLSLFALDARRARVGLPLFNTTSGAMCAPDYARSGRTSYASNDAVGRATSRSAPGVTPIFADDDTSTTEVAASSDVLGSQPVAAKASDVPVAGELVFAAEVEASALPLMTNLSIRKALFARAQPARAPVAPSPHLLTAQVNNARTGANLHETILTPANVNAAQFGRLFKFKVDGDVYAQPLYVSGVDVPGKGKHNVLFVATENDSVYAFDADGASADPLWHTSLTKSGNNARPLTEGDVRCFFIVPNIGITSTPVIDLKTGTLYVLARTKEVKGVLSNYEFKQRLHALAITTGAEKLGGPVEIKASIPHGSGKIDFDPIRENPRAALLLANGSVYLTWASSCDEGPYYGWVMSYDAETLQQKGVFNTAPDKQFSGIWQGDAGPAADKDGNVFVVTGNGEFDGTTIGRNFGDTVLKLGPGQPLALQDYFTPSNQQALNARDNDLGSSGPVLLPDQPGGHPHVLVTAGKEGKIYVIDRDHMGKFQPQDDAHAVQTLSVSRGAFGAMAYWNQNIFFIGSEAPLQDYSVDHSLLKLKAAGPNRFLDSGATPAVSANGTKDAIVWAASSKDWNEGAGRPAVLHAYDASDVRRELYNTDQNAGRDRAGVALRFAIPSIVNGKVYLGAKGEVDVYGLLPPH